MEALKFKLSGKFAHFKKPEYNKIVSGKGHPYFTFFQIPRTHLLGILGSVIGLNSFVSGYEYYNKLKDLKIAIIPKKATFKSFMHTFVDATGLVEGVGRTIMVSEKILVDPEWEIYILNDKSEEFLKIKDFLLNNKSIGHVYLGRAELFGNITDTEIVNVEMFDAAEHKEININSLFFTEDKLEKEDLKPVSKRSGGSFMYNEFLPYGFTESGKYIYKRFYYTNQFLKNLEKIDTDSLYVLDNEKILFFI